MFAHIRARSAHVGAKFRTVPAEFEPPRGDPPIDFVPVLELAPTALPTKITRIVISSRSLSPPRLCNDAPALLNTLLDGLIWRSRIASNGAALRDCQGGPARWGLLSEPMLDERACYYRIRERTRACAHVALLPCCMHACSHLSAHMMWSHGCARARLRMCECAFV